MVICLQYNIITERNKPQDKMKGIKTMEINFTLTFGEAENVIRAGKARARRWNDKEHIDLSNAREIREKYLNLATILESQLQEEIDKVKYQE